MALWGNTDYQNNAPKSTTFTSDRVAKKRLTGSGNVATTTSVADPNVITSFNNTTVGAFQSLTTRGTFGVTTNETQQAGIKGKGVSPGWVNVSYGTGPVATITVAASNATFNTSNFANGETVIISGATTNGSAVVTTNATGNLVSLSISSGAGGSGFTNAAAVTLAFARQKHVSLIVVGGTATGYSNTDVFTVSNGVSNAIASVSTNATGGTLSFTITNSGLFANTAANATAVVSVTNSTGGATGGSGATFTANLISSSNTGAVLTVSTMGGRAGRVQYENIAYLRSMNTTVDSENTVFANT